MELVEDWTSNHFVPFSPRHAMTDFVQPQTDLSLKFLDYNRPTLQQAADFYPVNVGHYRSQQNTDELEYIKNAIRMVLGDLQSSVEANMSASCNAAVHNEYEGLDDNSSSVGSMSDSQCDSDTEAHTNSLFDADCKTSHEHTSGRYYDPSCIQTELAFKMPVMEDWLPDNRAANVNNGCIPNWSISSEADAQMLHRKSTSLENRPHSKETSKHNNSGEQIQTDEAEVSKYPVADSDSQSSYSQQHLAASVCQPDDTQVEQKSSKSRVHHPHQKSQQRKNQKFNDCCRCKKSLAKSWQVQNVSKRCSLFAYKKEILNQHVPVRRGHLFQQVTILLEFFPAAYVYRVGQKVGHRLMTIILSNLNHTRTHTHLMALFPRLPG